MTKKMIMGSKTPPEMGVGAQKKWEYKTIAIYSISHDLANSKSSKASLI